jgi:hypothetical protein
MIARNQRLVIAAQRVEHPVIDRDILRARHAWLKVLRPTFAIARKLHGGRLSRSNVPRSTGMWDEMVRIAGALRQTGGKGVFVMQCLTIGINRGHRREWYSRTSAVSAIAAGLTHRGEQTRWASIRHRMPHPRGANFR